MPDRKLLLALSVASCIASAQTVSFNEDVLPILNQYCVVCHLPGAEQADLRLYPDAWSALVGTPSIQSELSRVEPGIPDQSYLYLKITGAQESVGGSGLQMPFQQGPLGPAQIETIRLWIEQGAKKN
jgi:hypothetical protein